jgi:hypothetical protein
MGPLVDGYGDGAVQMLQMVVELFVVKRKNKAIKQEINRKSRLCYVKNYNSMLIMDS